MRVIGQGNANILIDYGDPVWLYRCCVRFSHSLKLNNEYTLQNFNYIKATVRPVLGELLCPMELVTLPLNELSPLIWTFIENLDDDEINVIKIVNLKGKQLHMLVHSDHFTKVYSSSDKSNLLLEFKPKWLHNPVEYCRNCTHSNMKNRNIDYCYTILLREPFHLYEILKGSESLPQRFLEDVMVYFAEKDNVLRVLFAAQMKLHTQSFDRVGSMADVTNDLLLAMSLRDITCFIEWRSNMEGGRRLRVKVVDVDLKPKEKWMHWTGTHKQLESHPYKVYHTSSN